jgi:hypothetical protein
MTAQQITARHVHGRDIQLAVASSLDRFGQFRVAVTVDGKERWAGHFTDKTPDEAER